MNITVIGQGYVGLVTAACFAEWDHHVTGIDANPQRISALKAGRIPFHEPGLDELVKSNVAAGRLRFTESSAGVLRDSDVVFVAVGTHDGNGGWQTATILTCLGEIVPELPDRAVLVIRSTLPPEFVRQLGNVVDTLREQAGKHSIAVLLNPEFTREGAAILDFTQPERIVFGVSSDQDERGVAAMRQLYAPANAPMLVMPAIDAAFSKLGANLFLATKISFVNELASLCDSFGATIDNVVGAMSYDERIGGRFLHAGVGFGGSCLPHQVSMTVRTAGIAGVPAPLLTAVDDINHRRRTEMVDRLIELLDRPVDGALVAILGLTFKPHTDDLRDAPSLAIAKQLLERGATVVAYDPMETARTLAATFVDGLVTVASPEEALRGADAAAVVTEWPDIRHLDWAHVRGLMRGHVVFDGRNALDPSAVTAAGYRYAAFGRGEHEAPAFAMSQEHLGRGIGAVTVDASQLEPVAVPARTQASDRERAGRGA
ncbi:MAG: UDP-glucose dehydrogenase family protein [Candidatus Limnocylindria bacterium]